MKFSEWMEQRDRFHRPSHGGYAGRQRADTSRGYTDQYGMPIQGAEDIIRSQKDGEGGMYDVAGSTVSRDRKGIPGIPGSGAVNRFLFGPRKVSWRAKTGSGKGGAVRAGDDTPAGALRHYPAGSGSPRTIVNPNPDSAGTTGTAMYYRGEAPFAPARRLKRPEE